MKITDPLIQLDDIENLKKYKEAGQIATQTVNEIVKLIKPGCKLVELCSVGTKFVVNECAKIYPEVEYKGLSFPICLSINNVGGNYVPKDEDIANNGDMMKIELGVHIDGFSSVIAYTTLVGFSTDKKKKKLFEAIMGASKEIREIMVPGKTNYDVMNIMEKWANKCDCELPISNDGGEIPGVYSYQISRYLCCGYNDDDVDDDLVHKFILSRYNESFDFTLVETEFDKNEVYVIDILMSTGSGKLNATGDVFIYRRNHDVRVLLKSNSSAATLNLFRKEMFPLSLAKCDSKIKFGVKECVSKKLLCPYPVVKEKDGEYVARVKFTIVVKSEPILLCGKSCASELDKFK